MSLPSHNATINNVTFVQTTTETQSHSYDPSFTCCMRGFSASSSIKTHIPLTHLCHLIKGTWASSSPFRSKCSTFLSLDMDILCQTKAPFHSNCVFKQKLHCFGLVSSVLDQPNLKQMHLCLHCNKNGFLKFQLCSVYIYLFIFYIWQMLLSKVNYSTFKLYIFYQSVFWEANHQLCIAVLMIADHFASNFIVHQF